MTDELSDNKEHQFLDHNPTHRGQLPRLEREWLSHRSQEELINIIMDLVKRLPKTTAQLNPEVALDNIDELLNIPPVTVTSDDTYDRLPRNPTRRLESYEDTTWRIKLVCHVPNTRPASLEIYDDVFVGRAAGGFTPDLDLNPFGGEEYGVSRQHALLRPSQHEIYLVDLGSTNGTFHNGNRLPTGSAQSLSDSDVLSFGRLHFTIKVVSEPEVDY